MRPTAGGFDQDVACMGLWQGRNRTEDTSPRECAGSSELSVQQFLRMVRMRSGRKLEVWVVNVHAAGHPE
jgi:hypothetical protein